jgi:hypothetical protein
VDAFVLRREALGRAPPDDPSGEVEMEERLLMAFRADEVEEGDFVQTALHGPCEVIATERAADKKGVVIAITVAIPATPEAAAREHTYAPQPHEVVVLWEKR